MDPGTGRRAFTMADLMILVAGSAAGIAWTKALHAAATAQLSVYEPDWEDVVPVLARSPAPVLASISLAWLACRLRSPRPTLRRLSRQPGAVAMACVALVLALEGALEVAGWALRLAVDRTWPHAPNPAVLRLDSPPALTMAFASAVEAGLAIAACWILLRAVGRWRAEPGWLDRSGRVLGAAWIALYVIATLADSLRP